MKGRYPTCENCFADINPHIWEDCEKVYILEERTLCKSCFKSWLEEKINTSLDEVAEALGVYVTETESERE